MSYANQYKDQFVQLITLPKEDFIKFCHFMFAFHRAILDFKNPLIDLQALKLRVLNGLSMQSIVHRGAKIGCLRRIIETEGRIQLKDLHERDKFVWGALENCITAYLSFLLGYGNMSCICRHPAWHLTKIKSKIVNTLNAMRIEYSEEEFTEDLTLIDVIEAFSSLYSLHEDQFPGSAESLFKRKVIDSLCYLHFQMSASRLLKQTRQDTVNASTVQVLLVEIQRRMNDKLEAIT